MVLRFVGFTHSACHYYSQLLTTTQIGLATTLDTTLMDLVFEKLQIFTNELEMACSRWGMKINSSKCKIMSQDERHITLNDAIIDKVDL